MYLLLHIFILLSAIIFCVKSSSLPTNDHHEYFTHDTFLDPRDKYFLQWKFDEDRKEITFQVQVETLGWVGFGLSPSGGMEGSDIVIAWVDDADGKAFFHDRHAISESLPIRDEHQDWKLIFASQNSTHTKIQFTRALVTCDHEHDLPIIDDTMKIIFAWSQSDSTSGIDSLMMHERHTRGTKSIHLLAKSKKDIELEDDVEILDLVVKNITIPSQETTYWCKLFKMDFDSKRHIVKYDSKLEPGNEAFTHHFVVFSCTHPDPTQLEKYLSSEGTDCTGAERMPADFLHCTIPIMVWAVGGEPFYLPKIAGFPIGPDESETAYLLIQSHYDNPELISGRLDSSGVRIWHTKKLREHDAFTINFGSNSDYRLLIPPRQPKFNYVGHCHPKCLEKKLPSGGIKIFSSLLHAHYLGRELKARHFRGDKELPWIDSTKHYDFNFQQMRSLKSEISVLPGDQLSTECIFDSTKRKNATVGGFGTRNEMCMTFASYYPKMDAFKACFSNPIPSVMMSMAGVEQITDYKPNFSPKILLPKTLANKSLVQYLEEKNDWNDKLVDKSQHLLKYSKQRGTCYWLKTDLDEDFDDLIGYPELKEEYVPPQIECQKWDINNYLSQELVENQMKASITLTAFIAVIGLVFIIGCVLIRQRRYR